MATTYMKRTTNESQQALVTRCHVPRKTTHVGIGKRRSEQKLGLSPGMNRTQGKFLFGRSAVSRLVTAETPKRDKLLNKKKKSQLTSNSWDPQLRLSTSALVGNPYPDPQVFQAPGALPRSREDLFPQMTQIRGSISHGSMGTHGYLLFTIL